jgi:hypothetical protein
LKLVNRIAISPKMMGAAVVLVGLLVGGGAVYIVQAFAYQYPQTPTPVSGAMTGTFAVPPNSNISVSDGPVGPYTVLFYTPTFTLTGGINGSFACAEQVDINPNGNLFEYNALCTFTGTVMGGRGPGTMSVSWGGPAAFSSPNPEGIYLGSITFSQGTGGLRNIQSISGTIQGVDTPPPPFNAAANSAGIYTGLVVYNKGTPFGSFG